MNRAALTALALAGLVAFEFLRLIVSVPGLGLAGALCFVAFLAVGNDRLRLRERYLLVVAVISVIAAIVLVAEPLPLLADAARRAAYLAAFMLLLSVLRDGAMTSSSVLDVGRFMTHQPPSRRYWALAIGGYVMGVVMNFGALILLAPLVQRGAKDDTGTVPQAIVDIREQRQLSALALVLGWAINLTGSPFGATNLILARHTGVPVVRLAYSWNGVFSLVAFGIYAISLVVLA